MIPENSGQQWFRSLLQDDEAALEYFFQTHSPALLGYVSSIVDDTTEAEDICTAVFLSLWEARKTLESPEHLEKFLYLSIKHKAFSHLRKQKTLSSRQKEWIAVVGSQEEGADSLDLKDTELLKAMILQEIYHRADSLPPACKQVFDLHYRDGKKVNEIAEELQISPQTVRNQMSKAVGVIRRTLKDKKLLTHFWLLFPAL